MRISDWSSDVCSSDLRSRGTRDRCIPPPPDAAPPLDTEPPAALETAPETPASDVEEPAHRIERDEAAAVDRKSAVEGRSVSVRGDLGGRRIIIQTKTNIIDTHHYKATTTK